MKHQTNPPEFKTVREMLLYAFSTYATRIGVKVKEADDTVRDITFQTFGNDVFYAAEQIQECRGCHIGMLAGFSYAWLVFFCAVLITGNTAVLLNPDLSAQENAAKIKKADISLLLCDSHTLSIMQDCAETDSIAATDISSFAHAPEPCSPVPCDTTADDVCIILFTSGTTGESKAVQLSSENLLNDLAGCFHLIGKVLNPDHPTTNMTVLPPYHAYQVTVCLFFQIAYGGCVCIAENVRYFAEDLKLFRPGALVLVPIIVEMMYKRIQISVKKQGRQQQLERAIQLSRALRRVGIDLRRKLFSEILDGFGGTLYVIHCGGAPLDEKYVQFFDDIGIGLFFGYGISECSPVVACNTPDDRKAGSVGKPIPSEYVNVKIENGEILVKGKIVSRGYYQNPEADAEAFSDGWFRTGDLGRIDEDGFLFITGRKKNLIILPNGENVSPEILEEQLLRHPEIKEVLVKEKTLKSGARVIAADVFPNTEQAALAGLDDAQVQSVIRNIIKETNDVNPAFMKIEDITVLKTELPKNALGKVLRR